MKEISLTQGKVALVDDEDFDRVNQFCWYAERHKNTFYARRNLPVGGLRSSIRLHCFILNPADGFYIDHVNGNGLDNQKTNLRHATQSNNLANQRKNLTRKTSSRFKGVHWNDERQVWHAYISVRKKHVYLGKYDLEEEAARAYDFAAIKFFGAFASPNLK